MSTTEDHQGESQVYELGYLVLPSIPEENLSQVVESIKKVVNKAGGKELDGEDPFKHGLAYPMSKVVGSSKYVVNDAYIGWMKFELSASEDRESEHPAETIKKEIEAMHEVLRLLLIKAPRESAFTFAQALAEKKEAESPTEDTPDKEAASEDDASTPAEE